MDDPLIGAARGCKEPSSTLRAELLREGFTVLREVLTAEELRRNASLARGLLAEQQSPDYQARHRSIGSLFDILEEPGFVDLICSPRVLSALASLGFRDVRYQHGIVFNKLPRTPPTFWHQDGTTWSHPSSYEGEPLDLILIYYLVDTSTSNGCLRVIPGSHRKRHALHDALTATYTPELRRMADGRSPAFRTYPDEVSLPVRAGDLVILDARLLHAAHANASDEERTALSLWYLPSYKDLPEVVRARFTLRSGPNSRLPYVPAHWPRGAQARLRALLPPPYEGDAPPLPMDNDPAGLR